MTSLAPCRRCHRRETCQIKVSTLAGLKGLRISKATLRCKIPQEDFPIGARVSVQAFELLDAGYYEESYRKSAVSVVGIVTAWKGGKATVVLDKDQQIEAVEGNYIGHLKAEPDRLLRQPGSIVEMCVCGGLSRARCDAKDHPSLRDGKKWNCQRLEEEYFARHGTYEGADL